LALDAQISALAREFEERRREGLAISHGALYRMERYKALKAQIQQQVRRFENEYAEPSIVRWQAEAGAMGIQSAYEALQSSAPEVTGTFYRLPAEAVEGMVGLAGDGSPLFAVLKDRALTPTSVDGLVNALVRGTALGWNPNKTAQAMKDGLAGGLDKAITIARTEQMRVYRHAIVEQYRASGVVTQYKRLSARDSRTCMACLVSDGEVFPLDKELSDHPRGRCTAVPCIQGLPDVKWETGREWFLRQPESVQRRMMGEEYYESWKRGDFALGALRSTVHSDVWGDSPRVTPLSKLRRGVEPESVVVIDPVAARDAALSREEARIVTRTTERAVVVDEDGKVVFAKTGARDYVRFSDAEMAKLRGAYVTHNHPSGNSFSLDDVKLLLQEGLRELRAVGEQQGTRYRYVMRPQGNIDPGRFAHLVNTIERALIAEFSGKINVGIMTPGEANRLHHHELWSRVDAQLRRDSGGAATLGYRREEW